MWLKCLPLVELQFTFHYHDLSNLFYDWNLQYEKFLLHTSIGLFSFTKFTC